MFIEVPGASSDPLKPPQGNPTFSCDKCLKIYKNRSSLSRHINYECQGNRQKVACGHCGKKMNLRCNILKHIRLYHPGKPTIVLEYSKVMNAYLVKPARNVLRRRKAECDWHILEIILLFGLSSNELGWKKEVWNFFVGENGSNQF